MQGANSLSVLLKDVNVRVTADHVNHASSICCAGCDKFISMAGCCIIPFYFEYLKYDALFQYLVVSSMIKFSRLANETVKNCLYHTI